MEPIAYNLKGACEACGVSKDRIYNALNAGELSAKRLGGRTYFMADELERWLREQPDFEPRKIAVNERRRARREPVAA